MQVNRIKCRTLSKNRQNKGIIKIYSVKMGNLYKFVTPPFFGHFVGRVSLFLSFFEIILVVISNKVTKRVEASALVMYYSYSPT